MLKKVNNILDKNKRIIELTGIAFCRFIKNDFHIDVIKKRTNHHDV